MSIEREFLSMLGAARAMQELLNYERPLFGPGSAVWNPPTDVFETPEAVVVQMEVPRASPADFHIQVCPTAVCIQGRREDPDRRAKTRVLQMEIHYGAFTRMIELPCAVDPRQARGRYDGGMLELWLPKAAQRPKLGIIVTIDL